MFRLTCVPQKYEWGKFGSDSYVAKLQRMGEGIPTNPEDTYAEYWFGTHTNGPSKINLPPEEESSGIGSQTMLQDWLLMNPKVLGLPPYSKESALPFLFKVLSVRKALSVQAHPDRTLARQLHTSRPDLYRDPNHKPEMAVALTPFDAMCSFRELRSLQDHISRLPELRALVGSDAYDAILDPSLNKTSAREPMRRFYHALLNAPQDHLQDTIATIHTRLLDSHGNAPDIHPESPALSQSTSTTTSTESGTASSTTPASSPLPALPPGVRHLSAERVFLRLCEEYPGDVGVFSPFLLNTLRLTPGTGLFLAANEPHAYLSGDCVEIMATSDNVVRAGLTPKFKDVDTLVNMLTYKFGLPAFISPTVTEQTDKTNKEYAAATTPSETVSSSPSSRAPLASIYTYVPPVPEFQLERIELRSTSVPATDQRPTPSTTSRTGASSTETPPGSPPDTAHPPHTTYVDLPPSPCASILLVTELSRTDSSQKRQDNAPSDAVTDVLTDSLTATLTKPDALTNIATVAAAGTGTQPLNFPSRVALNPGQVWLLPAHASVRLMLRDTPAAAACLFRTSINPDVTE